MSALLTQSAGLTPNTPRIDDGFLRDPYPAYRFWRESAPIHWSDEFFGGAWLLARHEDVERMLRDPRFSAQRTGGWVMGTDETARAELKDFQQLFARAMLFVDGEDHRRLRRLMNAGFRPDAMQALAPAIDGLADELLAGIDATQGFDVMQALARPLPARVIARLLGVEEGEHAQFVAWSEGLAEFIGAPRPTLAQARRAQVGLLAMGRYFESRLQRGSDGDDLTSRLARAADEGTLRDRSELLAQCAMLLFAGYETTRNLLGNGLHHLLSHPWAWRELHQDPQRLPGAVRELLRFDSPVQYTGRRVAADLVLHGRQLRRGDLVIGLIGAANRDPRRFEEPDRLDVLRKPVPSLSFGSGPHVCIGAALTMVEAEAVLRQLLRRWPGLRLLEAAPEWNGNPLYRGLRRLKVATAA